MVAAATLSISNNRHRRTRRAICCYINRIERCIISAFAIVSYLAVVGYATESTGIHNRHDRQQKQEQEQQRNVQETKVGRVLGIRLINADTSRSILTIENGQTIRLPIPGATNFNFDAITTSPTSIEEPIGSVQFGYMNNNTYNVESRAPYSVCGDLWQSGTYKACPKFINNRQYTITATPYSSEKGKGMKGNTYTVQFTIQSTPPVGPPITAPTVPVPVPIIVKAPTKAPIRLPPPIVEPTKEPVQTPIQPSDTCRIPKLEDWEFSGPSYPIRIFEPQGLIIGNDMVLFSGFNDGFDRVTNRTYARDITIKNSQWRRMDDMPIAQGITHTARVLIGTKVYFCGGYIGGHPGLHTANCYIYDHSKPMGQSAQWKSYARLPDGGTAGGGMIYDKEQHTLYYAGGGQRLVPGNPHPVDVNWTWKNTLNDGKGWSASTPIPYAANHISYVTHTSSDGTERHFFLGGQEQEYECCRNLGLHYEFIPRTEQWVKRASLPLRRSHTTASTRPIGCGYIIAGGSINSGSLERERTDDISYYDIPNDEWVEGIGRLPREIATPVVDIHRANGRIYFLTGQPNTFETDISV